MAQITCENLTLGYDGKTVLENLNFSVDAGDYFCIVGENGSGKSTLMKTIVNLEPPMGGDVVLGDLLKADEIGYLPQQTTIQKDFPATVKEIVISGCQNRHGWLPFYTKSEKNRSVEAMEKMWIAELSNRCYRELSGGQQQKVLLARALCATKKMLLLDEPVAGLDPKATAELYHIIRELNEKEGITILMISHDMDAALQYAGRILHIGNPYFYGSKEEYKESRLFGSFAGTNGGVVHE